MFLERNDKMKTIVMKEINKLEKHFDEKDIKESWYYAVLQKMVNENNNNLFNNRFRIISSRKIDGFLTRFIILYSYY